MQRLLTEIYFGIAYAKAIIGGSGSTRVAFDNELEFKKCFEAACAELDARHAANKAHLKEQFAGRILEPESVQKNYPGHSAYREIDTP